MSISLLNREWIIKLIIWFKCHNYILTLHDQGFTTRRVYFMFLPRVSMKIIDASEPYFSKPMTENEVRDFLINSTKNIHISTLAEKGEPNIHPTWYYFHNNNEKIYVESGKDSKNSES